MPELLAVAVLRVPPGDLLDPVLDLGHPGVHPGVAGQGAANTPAHHSDLCVPEAREQSRLQIILNVDNTSYIHSPSILRNKERASRISLARILARCSAADVETKLGCEYLMLVRLQ